MAAHELEARPGRHSKHWVEPLFFAYFPGGQLSHIGCPGFAAIYPWAQVLHVVALCLLSSWYLPGGHTSHCTLESRGISTPTYVPGSQQITSPFEQWNINFLAAWAYNMQRGSLGGSQKSINLLNEHKVIQVRLRSRKNPGEPFVGLRKYKNYWSDNIISKTKRFLRPSKAHKLIGTSVYCIENPEIIHHHFVKLSFITIENSSNNKIL